MDFSQPLVPATLVSRYKRFFADVVLADGTPITAHCPNPGAMLGLNTPGLPCWLSRSDDPKRKLAHTLELVEADGGIVGINTLKALGSNPNLVGVNTMRPNALVAEALTAKAIPELADYATFRREVRFGAASRVDFLLQSGSGPDCWLEVKNCHLSRSAGLAEFPDCVAARSTKHLRELAAMVGEGNRAAVLFVVQRMDCEHFAPAADCDPTFAATLHDVARAGVEVLVYACDVTLSGVRLSHRVPLRLQTADAPNVA